MAAMRHHARAVEKAQRASRGTLLPRLPWIRPDRQTTGLQPPILTLRGSVILVGAGRTGRVCAQPPIRTFAGSATSAGGTRTGRLGAQPPMRTAPRSTISRAGVFTLMASFMVPLQIGESARDRGA